jgi:hypothetical protein
MDTDGNALESTRNTGYHQMADHDQHTLIERLEFAVDGDRQLAAALRGAAAALEGAAGRYEAFADVTDPDAAVGYLVNDPDTDPETVWCVDCIPRLALADHSPIWPEGTAAEEPCVACGQVLIDVAAGNSVTADPYESTRRPLDRIPETSEQLGGRADRSDLLARDHDSPATPATAPD